MAIYIMLFSVLDITIAISTLNIESITDQVIYSLSIFAISLAALFSKKIHKKCLFYLFPFFYLAIYFY